MSNRNRRKGHDFERKIRQDFKSLGWLDCETSRYASKMMDDRKIDLVNTKPFAVQCKASINNPSYHKIFKDMQSDAEDYKVIYHKRMNDNEYVIMQKKDFHELLEMLVANKIIKNKMISEKERRLNLLDAFEKLSKKEIEWCYNEIESDDWSKLHDVIKTLKQKYL